MVMSALIISDLGMVTNHNGLCSESWHKRVPFQVGSIQNGSNFMSNLNYKVQYGRLPLGCSKEVNIMADSSKGDKAQGLESQCRCLNPIYN